MKSFYDYVRDELVGLVERPVRAARVYKSVYRERAEDFEKVGMLPAAHKNLLAASMSLRLPACVRRFDSRDGTRRYLVRLEDGETVESVLIPNQDRVTFCISSQVGCALACTFCLTGQLGLIRDLSPGEIVSQVVLLERDWFPQGGPHHFSVVLMGMGEPLHNYDNVVKSIRILHDDHGMGVPLSRITLSTAGLLPGLERLSTECLFPNLSISMTGATNEARDVLMPINRKYPIEALIGAVRRMPVPRQKRVMFEYVMIKDVTDSIDDAERLSGLLRGLCVKVNLIPLNASKDIGFERPPATRVLRF
jgi:23S rRNA (adenine2503-C2)-methyltransferase